MSKVRSPLCYVYDSDEEKTMEENLRSAMTHVTQALRGQTSFRICLELDLPMDVTMDAEETAKLIEQALRDTAAMEKSEFVPVAIDRNGKPLYQRREDSEIRE